MAKDVITRFKLETTAYDSKLKSAAKGLADFAKTATNAGSEFGKFTQKNVEAARALGNTATSATNVKDKTKELVGAYNELARTYNTLTKQQQQSDFGKAMAQSLTQLQQRIRETKQELQGLTNTAAKVGGGGLNNLIGGIAGKFGMSAQMFTGVGAGIAAFSTLQKVMSDNVQTALGFEKSMSQLSSLTGKTGKDLEQLKEYAIELGSKTTLSASQVADAFRLIGSQQPQLLESSEALKAVTKNAITLAEAAGIDLQTAAQTLSTSINQMGGDSDNAARYINVLAAASQKGAGDIAWLGEAITKSATAAKAVGTDYEELVANLEQLAKAGFDASTAGTALRSIIMNLEKQANNEFKPSIVGLTTAFENLSKANLDIVGYQQIAGKMFASQAMALANAAGEARKMTAAITGTNTAEEQAKTNTDNLDGSLKSLASAWEGLNLHINSSNGFLRDCVDWLKDVVTWADKTFTAAGRAAAKLAEMQGGGNGQPTKVDRQVNALGGSNFKQQKFNSQMNQYNQDIKVAEYYLRKYQKEREKGLLGGGGLVLSDASRRFGGVKLTGEEDLQNLLDALMDQRDEYQSRGKKILETATTNTTTGINGNGTTVTVDVDADTEEATNKIKELQDKLKNLNKLRDEAANKGDTKLRDDYNQQIKGVKAQIKALRGGTTTTTTTKNEQTEIQQNQKEIDTLTKKYQKLSDAEKTATGDALKGIKAQKVEIQGNIKQLQDRNKELKRMADEAQGINQFPEGSLPALNKQLRELQEAQSKAANGEEYRKLGAEIDTVTRRIAILKGELPKGQTATITVSVDESNAEELKKTIEGIGDKDVKITTSVDDSGLEDVSDEQRTVTFTADDRDVVAKVLEMQHINIDPKTLEFRANDAEALKSVEGMKNVTIDQKTLTVIPQTQEAAKELLKLNTFKLVDKQVAVTVNDEKAMKDLQAVAKVTIPEKEVKVKVSNPKAVDVKVNEVAGTQHQAPTLKPIEQTVNYKQGDVDLQDIPDEKTVRVDYEQGDMPDMPDDEQRTVTFMADDTDVKKKVDDIEKKDITAKKVKLEISTENAETFKNITKQLEAQGIDRNVEFTVTPKVDKKAFTFQNLGDQIAEMKRKLNNEMVIGTQDWIDMQGLMADATAIQNILQTAIQNGMKVTAFNPQELWKRILGGTDIATEELQNMLDQLNEYLKEKGLEPMKLNFETGEMSKDKSSDVFKESMQKYDKLVGGLTQVASGLKNLGIELPEGVNKFLSGLQGISQIIQGVSSVLSVFGISALGSNTVALGLNTSGLAAVTAALYTNAGTNLIPFLSTGGMNKDGRIIHAAVGTVVPGNYGHDAVPAMLTSGEVVLNRAEVGNLVSQLNGGAFGDLHLEARFDMDGLRVALDNDSKWRSKGVYVTSKMR